MVLWFSVPLSEAVTENRWAAEFHRPGYKFVAKDARNWRKIGRCSKLCQYGLSIKMNDTGKGVPIYRLNEIEDCFLTEIPSKFAPISASVAHDYQLQKNDILFCRTNGNINFVGRTGLFVGDKQAVFASYLVRVRTDSAKLLPEYLTIFLNSRFGRRQILRRAMPSNQVNVSAAELKRIDAFLAPTDFQENIADIVQSAYEYRKQGILSYGEAVQLLESELELDKLNFQKPIGWTACASDLANSRRSDAEFYDPVAREVVKRITALQHSKLRESFHVGNGFPWKGSKFRTDNSGEPVVRIRNIKPSYIDTAELTSIDPGYANSIGFPKAQRGDVVVGMDGIKYFYASLLEGECYVNQRVSHLSPKNDAKVSPEFAVFILNSRVGQAQLMRDMTVATTVGHITNRDVAKLVIPTISQDFHDKITALVRKSIDAKEESKRLLAKAKARVDQLIEEAIQS